MPPTRALALVLVAFGGCAPRGPTPSIDSVSPALLCDQAPATVTIGGSGFGVLVADLANEARLERPTVRLVRAGSVTGEEDGIEAEITLSHDAGMRWISEQELEIDVGPELGLVEGAWDVIVELATGQEGARAAGLIAIAPPRVDGTDPAEVCAAASLAEVGILGANFVVGADGAYPTVTVGDLVVTAHAAEGCHDLAGGLGQVCGTILADVDGTQLDIDAALPISVVNPGSSACGATEGDAIAVVPPPTVTAVTPGTVCNGGEAAITIEGTRFLDGTQVVVGGYAAVSVEVVDSETIIAYLDPATPTGPQDVEVVVPSGCEAALGAGIDIRGAGDVFFVDPPGIPAGKAVLATALTTRLTAEPVSVYMVDAAGNRVDVDFVFDPSRETEVKFRVPSDLTIGEWDVGVETGDGCGNTLEDAFEVVKTGLMLLEEVEPKYSWQYDYTAVEVRGGTDLPPAFTPFQDVPRLYLTPMSPDTGTAASVQGVSYRGEALLTAVIPYGLEPGWYGMVATNPDGTIGYKDYAVQITDQPPPEIDTISPPSLPNSSDGTIEILGSNFRDPTVTLTCIDRGVVTTPTATVTSWEYGVITAVVPSSGFHEAVCTVTVMNADFIRVTYSSISIRNPAENLFPWIEGPDLNVARRAPAAAAGRTSAISRYVYAIGGDDGDISGAMTSIEGAVVSPYGEIGPWQIIGDMPVPRTMSAPATIGQYVYQMGGWDGTKPSETIWRARILDPIYVPHYDELAIERGSPGLGGGAWTYRVAGLYEVSDYMNPSGETLPGEPIAVKLPDDGDTFQVTLTWTPVDRVSRYRIYRSPVADGPSGELEWVADVTGTSWTDEGDATQPTHAPLPEGSLGKWRGIGYLNTLRYAACVAVAPDPNPDPQVMYIYVAGGLDKNGDPLTSIEYLPVTIVSSDVHEHPILATKSAQSLSEARSECVGYTIDSSLHSVVAPGETWVYFAGGRDATRAVGTVDSGLVTAGGELSPWQVVDDMSPARAGFGGASASDFLFAFGGHNGAPSKTGVSSELDGLLLPDLVNWNSLGKQMNEDRYLPGFAQESSVIFMLGGTTSSASASAKTEYTNY